MIGFRPFLVLLGVVFAVLFSGCKTIDERPNTAITLEVTSDTELSRLVLIFRNLGGDEQRVDNALGFDIRNEAFVFSIRPGERFQDEVFIWVQGFLGDDLVAQASRLSRFESGLIVEEKFELRASFIDNDGDGFSPCSNGPSCDCDDTQAAINPLAEEICGDVIDNNCNGAAEEDCPCVDDQICTVVPETFIAVSAGVGRCQFGVRRCNDGVLGEECEGALGIGDEEVLGNYIDDDCDGSVDEGGDCVAGASRPCFLGFVDDAGHPNPDLRTGASDRALGVCQLGVQECNPTGTWSSCQGEVRPQRDPESGVFKELTSQCDGLDNDCDGVIDDESYFDADGDGFTRCGTCRELGISAGLCAESIDCNDADPLISPDAIELCGNDVDENCRCDHDDNDRPVGADSAISKPSLLLDGSRNCASRNASLDCARLPRSDPQPTGVCSDLPQPYFAGFVEDESGFLGACMSCGLAFGLQCLEEGGCSDPSYDCSACSVADEVYAARPYCTRPDPSTCRNTEAPVFVSIFDEDPYDDCGFVDCRGFYSGIVDGRCFRRADIDADAVFCQGTEACESAGVLCPQATAYDEPEDMPLCTFIAGGCEAQQAPDYQNQVSGSDSFDECNNSYRCDNAESGFGPYFDGIATQNGLTYCFYKENIENSSCNGEGGCQSKPEACLASTQGSTVPLRPQCELAVSGCQGISAPLYGVVERFQDPYNDCGTGLGCCVDPSGDGTCCRAQGNACSVDTECGEGLSCVEGVCCNGLCDSPCESCLGALNTAGDDGVCAPLANRQTDSAPVLVCGDGIGGCGGDLGCECVAETGECRREIGSLCEQGNQCSTTLCECIDGDCSMSRCAPEQCDTCRFDSDQDGTCEGFIIDGADDFSGSCGALGCNGLGACNIENGLPCSINQECLSNICRQGVCGPEAGVGETCDEDLDCLAPARCEVGFLCGIPGIETTQVGGVSLVEGGSSVTVAIGITSQPSSETVLQLEASNSEFLISPLSLSFGPDDWSNPKIVTLTAFNDVVDDGDISGTLSVFVSSSGDSGYQSIDALSLAVLVVDNDVAGFVVSPSSGFLQLSEGETESGSLALATQPTANVRVSFTTSDATEVIGPGALIFTPANWSSPQSFTFEAPTDSLVDGDQSVTLTLAVSSSSDTVYTNLDPSQLTISVVDIDQAGLILTNTSSLEVDESGSVAEFQVALSAEPESSVTVPLSLEPTGQARLESSSLTFASANWNTPQTVRIVGLDDFVDDDTVAFYVDVGPTNSLDAQFVGYTRQVLVTALDDDQAGISRGDPSQETIGESGGTVTYLVTLNSEPTSRVTIPVVSQNSSISVSPSVLDFTSSNWSTGLTVTATGIDDAIAQGDRSVGISWGPSNSDDPKYQGLSLLATSLTVVDDDVAGIDVGNDNLGVGESGSSVLAKFRLSSQPTQVVELSFSGGVGEVSFSPSSLTFTSVNWNTYQFVTVTGQDDNVEDGLQVETITVQAASLDAVYQGQSTTFTVQNADNDIAGVSLGVLAAPTIAENGGSTTFTLGLDTRPLHDVTISFAVNSGRGLLSNGFQVFTPSQWDEVRVVTVEAVDDSVDNGNALLTISATVSSLDVLYDDSAVADQSVTIVDDDDAGMVFGAVDSFTVTEGSPSEASTTVKLSSQPTDDVTLSFVVDSSEVLMVSSPLTFTALNWNQNQAVVFRSADDFIDDGAQDTLIQVTSSSNDSNYSSLSQNLGVTTDDNDTVGIAISRTATEIEEGGATATVSVELQSEPTADVFIDFVVSTSDLTISKTRLTFTASNWDVPQTMVVSASNDVIYEGTESATLTVKSSASSDSLYANLSDQEFDFTIRDNETEPEISISDISVVEADSSVALTVSVAVSPVSNQAITIAYSTEDDTASAGADYQSAAGNVVIPAGDASGTILITVLGDNLAENSEDFALRLTSTSVGSFTLGGDQATITITDDDAEPSITAVSAGTTPLSAALDTTTTLVCAFTDSDFTSESDYTLTLAVRAPDNTTTTLCSSVSTSQSCGAGGSPVLTEPSSGSYQFAYVWDPAGSFSDGDYDVRCVVNDGTNSDASGHGQNSNLLTLDSTSPTVVEVREASGGGGFYEENDALLIEIEFSEAVTLNAGGSLKIELDVSSTAGIQGSDALYFSGSGTSILTFIYDVEASSWADTSDLDYSSDSALQLGSGATLVDIVGNAANLTLPALGSASSLSGTSDIQLN